MVYCFHHFYYWSKGGVETSQAYRARMFRNLGIEAKFVFATTFLENNYVDEMDSLGYDRNEVTWLYSSFSDCSYAEYSYTLKEFKNTIAYADYSAEQENGCIVIRIPEGGIRYVVELAEGKNGIIKKVFILVNECLLRVDYYTACRAYSDFYHPEGGTAVHDMRRFYNTDGTVAYDILNRDGKEIYKFADRILHSREELVGYFFEKIKLTEEDTVIIDCEPGNIDLSAFVDNAYPARVVLVLHSNHYVLCDDDNICWYYFYEYALNHPEKIDCFVVNTEEQKTVLQEQLAKYRGVNANVVSIPASGIDSLTYPTKERKKHSIISAGRLADEKHFDVLIKTVVKLKEKYNDINLDIYGSGSRKDALQTIIDELGGNEYIRLMGFASLEDIYKEYDIYASTSESETFGITLLEALGSGLPLVAYDAPYGAPNFISNGKTGYLVDKLEVEAYAEKIEQLFENDDMECLRFNAYEKAAQYLTEENEKKWRSII